MVQTLATMLMTYVQRPSLQQCGIVAKALIGKYEFLRDDEGDGEVSILASYPGPSHTEEGLVHTVCVCV